MLRVVSALIPATLAFESLGRQGPGTPGQTQHDTWAATIYFSQVSQDNQPGRGG